MLDIYLNRVAIWKPVAKDGIDMRPSPNGVSYLTKDSMVYKQSDGPLYRYVKNYKAGKGKEAVKFSLFLRTDRTDDKIEKELDALSTKFPVEYIQQALKGATITNFVYTDTYIKDKEAL